jgi:hypothetical protein
MDMPGNYRGIQRGSAAACGRCSLRICEAMLGNSRKAGGGHGASCWRLRNYFFVPLKICRLQNAAISAETQLVCASAPS